MRVASAGILCYLLVALSELGMAVPRRPVDISALTARSDVIVTGQVLSVAGRGTTTLEYPGGSTPAALLQARIGVDHVVKGQIEGATLAINFLRPQEELGYPEIEPGQYGLFFIAGGPNSFELADRTLPCLPSVRNAGPLVGPPLGQVTTALGRVLLSTGTSDSDRDRALDALRRLPTEAAAGLLEDALKSASGKFRLDVARSLVARDDIAGLPVIEEALLRPGGLPQETVLDLEGSLAGLKDPRAVPSLSRIAEGGPPDARRFAAAGLRRSGSTAALRPLVQLLGDADPDVRYYAVAGLGEITHQDEWTPSRGEFEVNETRYISHWREWAGSNLN